VIRALAFVTPLAALQCANGSRSAPKAAARAQAPADSTTAPKREARGERGGAIQKALAIRQDGDDLVCEDVRRCRFRVDEWTGELHVKALATGAAIEYGKGGLGTGSPELPNLLAGIQRSPTFLGDERNDLEIGARVAILVRFADGAIAKGEVPLTTRATRGLLESELQSIMDYPIEVPNDSPHTGTPRAMWVTGGDVDRQLYGTANTLAELDWILVVGTWHRSVSCPGGGMVWADDTRARVYERRTGKVVGERIFRASFARGELCGHFRALHPRRAKRSAEWAWTMLRNRAPHALVVEPP
jgi:hypothetical protein